MQKAAYVRMYADSKGESHFEDVEVEMQPVDFAPPAAPLNIVPLFPAVQTLLVGESSGWGGDVPHPAPQRQVFITTQGEFEVTVSDGEVRRFPVGSVLLLEDTTGKGHSTRIIGDSEAVVFGVTLGE
ncbi:MAG: hypothetical protein O2854_09070 [Chloroflexi bacterium]|nr:hypothetical protein [Chloroflexota bacterium]